MKHDATLAPQAGDATEAPMGDLMLVAVLGVRHDGGPLLAGRQADVVLTPLPEGKAQVLLAVCKPFGGGLAVLGYVGRAEAVRAAGGGQFWAGQLGPGQLGPGQLGAGQGGAVAEQPTHLSLGIGRAEIRLHADGRIRLKGTDIALEASGRIALAGAWIDLN